MQKSTFLKTCFLSIIGTVLLTACAGPNTRTSEPSDAAALAQSMIIVDTHIDVPYRLHRRPADVTEATEGGDFDYPRARQGGLNAPFMSIYIPASTDEAGEAKVFADKLIDDMEALTRSAPDKFAIATCVADVRQHFRNGVISLPLGMENGGPIDNKISNLEHFYDRGIRYITLTHSKSNHISDSSYDENKRWLGLSPFGQALIEQMNNLGVMIDVSHVSDSAFWQVLALSDAPVIATHSSLRHFTPGFERNMTDAMVKAIARRGGVVHINFGSSFIHQAARDYGAARTAAVTEYAQTHELEMGDEQMTAYLAEYAQANPYPYATLEQVLDHIDRVVALAGVDAVGIGSDYDGVGDSLPTGLKDAATYPSLIKGLLDRGYSIADVKKIMGENSLRVWREVERYAAGQGNAVQCAGDRV